MNSKEFKAHMDKRLVEITSLLWSKSEEYARKDQFSNFRRGKDLMYGTEEKVLWGFLVKHLISISDFIEDLENGKIQPIEKWEEKIGDMINYGLLLDGMLHERLNLKTVILGTDPVKVITEETVPEEDGQPLENNIPF